MKATVPKRATRATAQNVRQKRPIRSFVRSLAPFVRSLGHKSQHTAPPFVPHVWAPFVHSAALCSHRCVLFTHVCGPPSSIHMRAPHKCVGHVCGVAHLARPEVHPPGRHVDGPRGNVGLVHRQVPVTVERELVVQAPSLPRRGAATVQVPVTAAVTKKRG